MTFVLILMLLSLVPLLGGLYFLFKGLLAGKRAMILTGLGFMLAWGMIFYAFWRLFDQEF